MFAIVSQEPLNIKNRAANGPNGLNKLILRNRKSFGPIGSLPKLVDIYVSRIVLHEAFCQVIECGHLDRQLLNLG
jgi:hypothetical protein